MVRMPAMSPFALRFAPVLASVRQDHRLFIRFIRYFRGRPLGFYMNSHGTHGIHGPLTALNVLGFPTPRSYPTGGGLRVHETRNEGLGEDKNK